MHVRAHVRSLTLDSEKLGLGWGVWGLKFNPTKPKINPPFFLFQRARALSHAIQKEIGYSVKDLDSEF